MSRTREPRPKPKAKLHSLALKKNVEQVAVQRDIEVIDGKGFEETAIFVLVRQQGDSDTESAVAQ